MTSPPWPGPGDAGREYWISQLTSRASTYGRLAVDFLASGEFYQKAGQDVP